MKTGFVVFSMVICLSCTFNYTAESPLLEANDTAQQKKIQLKNFYDTLRYPGLPEVQTQLREFDFYTGPNSGFHTQINMQQACSECCKAYKRVTDSLAGFTVYFVKKDCGNKGFLNAQYLFSNGRLALTRNFSVVSEHPADSVPSSMLVEERIYNFGSEKVIMKSRKKTIRRLTDLTFTEPFKSIEMQEKKTRILIMKIKEFKDNLNLSEQNGIE
ncbi:MAG: hypothetical protein H7296_14910 [Bacteroidia bacterium]|nr:hypothetical protein [Bacteroidia bacterium]